MADNGLRGLDPQPTAIGQDITMAIDSDPDALGAPATVLRASDALACARRIGFRLLGVPADLYDDWDPQTRARGQAVDRLVKQVLRHRHGAEVDVHFDFVSRGVPLEGIGDAVYPLRHDVAVDEVAVEVKTTTTKKLMGVLGNWRSMPAGPEASWVAQAGLLALARGAKAVHIICVPSDDRENRHPPAEWVIDMDDELVHLPVVNTSGACDTPRTLATRELRRQGAIWRVTTDGTLPRRAIPGYGLVLYPPAAGQEGDPWLCKFCAWQPSCARLGADEVPTFKAMRGAA